MPSVMRSKRPQKFILALLVAVGLPLHAATSLSSLASQDTRPTMAQILKALPEKRYELNEFPRPQTAIDQRYSPEIFLEVLLKHGPALIATLEKTFPGATWAFMGRDTQQIADLVEAFYLTIGQNNRVVRLGVSKSSMTNATHETLVGFLESNGFSLEHAGENHPYILVDTVSKGFGKQGRTFIGSVYQEYELLGGNAADLLRKLNMMGLVVSTFQGTAQPFQKAEEYIKGDEKAYRERKVVDFINDHTIITYADPGNYANEAGYEHFVGAWHKSFQPFITKEDGSIISPPGPPSNMDIRESIVWMQVYLLQNVREPEFLKRVESAASRLGYSFPHNRPKAAKTHLDLPSSEILKKLVRSAKQVDQQLMESPSIYAAGLSRSLMHQPTPPNNDAVSPGGLALLTWLSALTKEPQSSHHALEAFRALHNGYQRHQFNDVDLKQVFQLILSSSAPSFTLLEEIEEFARVFPSFEGLWNSRHWIWGQAGDRTFIDLHRLKLSTRSCARSLLNQG